MPGAATTATPSHRRGAATQQTAVRRRNPKGAKGLGPWRSLLVVDDATASPSSSRLGHVPKTLAREPCEVLQKPAG